VGRYATVKFEFQATVDVVMHWSDENMWAECMVGLCAVKLNPVDPQLETAWFQPLNLK
jgi:hypothetical protein